ERRGAAVGAGGVLGTDELAAPRMLWVLAVRQGHGAVLGDEARAMAAAPEEVVDAADELVDPDRAVAVEIEAAACVDGAMAECDGDAGEQLVDRDGAVVVAVAGADHVAVGARRAVPTEHQQHQRDDSSGVPHPESPPLSAAVRSTSSMARLSTGQA